MLSASSVTFPQRITSFPSEAPLSGQNKNILGLQKIVGDKDSSSRAPEGMAVMTIPVFDCQYLATAKSFHVLLGFYTI